MAMKSAAADLKDEKVPPSLYWTVDQVADWIEKIGLPDYKSCIYDNRINGRKLIQLDTSHLPDIGIKDFEHMKVVAKGVRELLMLEEPDWTRSISDPPRSQLGMYLEKKCGTGKEHDGLAYQKFLLDFKDAKWQPPLSNHCQILPSY